MDEQIDTLVVSVRADTAAFARDVASMRGQLEGPLATGVSRAGQLIDNALASAIRTGKVGFDDLKKRALSAMSEIEQSSLRALFSTSAGTGGNVGTGLLNGISSLVSGLLGSPGRATGGPVSQGQAYLVGERGPELFVPNASGRIETAGSRSGDLRVSISVQTPTPSDPQVLRQSSRQLARAVRTALTGPR
jgi:hypothetical protein